MRPAKRWPAAISAAAVIGASMGLAAPALADVSEESTAETAVEQTSPVGNADDVETNDGETTDGAADDGGADGGGADGADDEVGTDGGTADGEAGGAEGIEDGTAQADASEEPTEVAPLLVDGDALQTIGEIRDTAKLNSEVTTRGWVTASYPTGGLNGFVIQTAGSGGGACDFDAASEAIFVYTNHSANIAPTPAVGAYVEVVGTYTAFNGLFQIATGKASEVGDHVTVLADTEGIEPAEAVTCAWPGGDADALGSIQSMLYEPEGDFVVTNNYSANQYGELGLATGGAVLQQPTDVAPYDSEKYKEVVAYNAAHLMPIDDGSSWNFLNATNSGFVPPYVDADGASSVGATVEFTEPMIVDYRNNTWKLNPTRQVIGEAVEAPMQNGESSGIMISDVLPTVFTYERPGAPSGSTLGNPDLVVGGFNLENYFPTSLGEDWNKLPGANCTSYNDRFGNPITVNRCSNVTQDGVTVSNPRGAWNQAALDMQTGKLVTAINSLDASALGVMELENSYKLSFGDASKAGASAAYLVAALNKAAGTDKWAYIEPNLEQLPPIAQQDVMYPGIIYQPGKVTPIGDNLSISDQSGEGGVFSNARAPFGQAFEPVDGGAPFFLVANHFKSKSSPGTGAEADLGQGGWNASRTAQAKALATWIDEVALPTLASEGTVVSDVVLVGDFNSYTFEDPMLALYDAGYVNVNVKDGVPENVSYNYSGLNGSLDHVIVSSSATSRTTGHAIWGINHPETIAVNYSRFDVTAGNFVQDNLGQPWRSSDHDPAVVGFEAAGVPATGTVDLQLLNINDFHGRIDGVMNDEQDALTSSSTVNFAYTLENLKEEHGYGNSLFLSAGDNVGASLFASALQGDEPTIDLLNVLGLEATASGNHEFDGGWPGDVERIAALLDAPILAANVIDDSTGEIAEPFQAYTMLESAGLKVAVIGVVTQETPTLVNPANVAGLTFLDPVDTLNKVVAELKALPVEDQPDIIVAEYHEGSGVDEEAAEDLQAALDDSAVFAKIVNGTDAAVDVIFTGHTHKRYAWEAPVPGVEGKTRPVLETGSYGEFIGQVVLTVDAESGDVVDYTVDNVPVAGAAMDVMTENQVVAEAYEIVLAAMQNADEVGSQVAGYVAAPITTAFTGGAYEDGVFVAGADGKRDDRSQASTLGTLVSEMLKASMADLPEAPDFGVTNPGGLRSDLMPGADGAITVAQARSVLPFNNELSVVTLTGEQVVTMLEQQWQRNADGSVPSRSYLQLGLSDNVSYTYSVTQEEVPDKDSETGMSVVDKGVIESVTINGEPIDLEASYKIGTFEFLASGGDNFWVFAESSKRTDTGYLDWESWLNYLATGTQENPIEPDFVRQGVRVEGLPSGDVEAGGELELVYSGMNIHSVGAPANTELTVSVDPLTRSVVTVPIETVRSETGVWTDSATVSLVVPEVEGVAVIDASAAPTGTWAVNYVSVAEGAVTPPPGERTPSISVDPAKVVAGGTVTVTGKDFVPGETVSFSIGDKGIEGSVVVGADGTFSVKVAVAKDLKAGTYTLTAKASGGDVATVSLVVTAAGAGGGAGGSGSGGLPSTGADVMLVVLAALMLAGAGVATKRFAGARRS